jgi:hypothetical protein
MNGWISVILHPPELGKVIHWTLLVCSVVTGLSPEQSEVGSGDRDRNWAVLIIRLYRSIQPLISLFQTYSPPTSPKLPKCSHKDSFNSIIQFYHSILPSILSVQSPNFPSSPRIDWTCQTTLQKFAPRVSKEAELLNRLTYNLTNLPCNLFFWFSGIFFPKIEWVLP